MEPEDTYGLGTDVASLGVDGVLGLGADRALVDKSGVGAEEGIAHHGETTGDLGIYNN